MNATEGGKRMQNNIVVEQQIVGLAWVLGKPVAGVRMGLSIC